MPPCGGIDGSPRTATRAVIAAKLIWKATNTSSGIALPALPRYTIHERCSPGPAWAVTATALAYRLFMRRDFTDQAYDGVGGRVLLRIEDHDRLEAVLVVVGIEQLELLGAMGGVEGIVQIEHDPVRSDAELELLHDGA